MCLPDKEVCGGFQPSYGLGSRAVLQGPEPTDYLADRRRGHDEAEFVAGKPQCWCHCKLQAQGTSWIPGDGRRAGSKVNRRGMRT